MEIKVEAPADAVAFLNETINDDENPVVMFSHEWCEFCWSVRKMFAKYEIPYVTIDLDSVAYQQDNKGGKIRAALLEKTGSTNESGIPGFSQCKSGVTAFSKGCIEKWEIKSPSYTKSLKPILIASSA